MEYCTSREKRTPTLLEQQQRRLVKLQRAQMEGAIMQQKRQEQIMQMLKREEEHQQQRPRQNLEFSTSKERDDQTRTPACIEGKQRLYFDPGSYFSYNVRLQLIIFCCNFCFSLLQL